MNYYFVMVTSESSQLDWTKLFLSPNHRYILIADPHVLNNLTGKELFWKIFKLDFYEMAEKAKRNADLCFLAIKEIIDSVISGFAEEDDFFIVSLSEEYMLDCARLREHFDLSGDRPANILRFLDKQVMKESLIAGGLEQKCLPRHLVFDKLAYQADRVSYFHDIMEALGSFPLFVKPVVGTGTIDIARINTAKELQEWCEQHAEMPGEYEINEYIHGELYHCASIVVDDRIVFSAVSRYLHPLAECLLRQKNLGTIFLREEDPISQKLTTLNRRIVSMLVPIGSSVMHAEFFIKPDGEPVFLEIAKRCIAGGAIAELFGDQFGLSLRHIDAALKLGLDMGDFIPTPTHLHYAEIAPPRLGKPSALLPKKPKLTSTYQAVDRLKPNYSSLVDDYVTDNVYEFMLSHEDYGTLLKDFESFKAFDFFDDVDVSFRVIGPDDLEEVLAVLAESFTQAEPLTQYLRIDLKEFRKVVLALCSHAVSQGLSILVTDNRTHRIVGCRITEKFSQDEDMPFPALSPEFETLFGILGQASAPLMQHVADPSKLAHFIMMAVDKEYRGLGLSKYLLALSLAHLKAQGFHYACGEFTNPTSQRAICSILVGERFDQENVLNYRQDTGLDLRGELRSGLISVDNLNDEFKAWAARFQRNGNLFTIGDSSRSST